MKVEGQISFSYEYNNNKNSKGVCSTTVSEGDLQVVREVLRAVPRPEGSDKELSMFDKLDVRRCEHFELYDSN
jgi:hypothetical protein